MPVEPSVAQSSPRSSAPGIVGILLIAICWPLNWTLPGVRTAYLFFPLWLGYVLVIDALVFKLRGQSIWSRSPWKFWGLFVASSPVWWIFELINNRTGNWEYLGAKQFTPFEHYFLCTLSFSTVMPAVFETAELMRGLNGLAKIRPGRRFTATPLLLSFLFFVGVCMLALALTWPRYCYPFVWTSILFLLEPINSFLRRPVLLERIASGDYRAPIALALGALVCGFFWELWNFYSYPKWIYHTPGAQFLHLFEMPLLGYGGYLPFGWELFALHSLLWPGSDRLNL